LKGIVITLVGGGLGYFSYPLLDFLLGPDMAREMGKFFSLLCFLIILFGIGFLLFAHIQQTTTELVITNRRIFAKVGFIARTTVELMLNRVEGASVDQTILGRLFGYGFVWVKGTGQGVIPIDFVAEPGRFHAALMAEVGKIKA
jgi:Bacterial PH domain